MTGGTERLLRRLVADTVDAKERQGYVVGEARDQLARCGGIDALLAVAVQLQDLPLRDDWAFVEPDDMEAILAECEPARPTDLGAPPDDVAERIAGSFLAAICGCVLGKPIEVQASAAELRAAAKRAEEAWPPMDYLTPRLLDELGRRVAVWQTSVRGGIDHVPEDDDINLRILAMLLLEEHGAAFDGADVVELWTHALPIEWVWASNRTFLLKAALRWWRPGEPPLESPPVQEWVRFLNPYDEDCGAVIRVDPYGWACPGRPGDAARLAWQDASVTHTRTGVYAAMFQAAAVAAALVLDDPMEAIGVGLGYVPARSRLHRSLATAVAIVQGARDWEDAYRGLEDQLGGYGHCQIHLELGTVINTLRFARGVGDGLGIQVAQGLDTDSFGACAGALLGARYGRPDAGWTDPFRDDLRTTVATFHERSLEAVAARMAALPQRL